MENTIAQNHSSKTLRNIGRVAVGTLLLLLIPLIGRFPWSLSDFVIMGILIFGAGSAFVLVTRTINNPDRRIAIGIVTFIIFALIWAELAVGIFNSPIAGS